MDGIRYTKVQMALEEVSNTTGAVHGSLQRKSIAAGITDLWLAYSRGI